MLEQEIQLCNIYLKVYKNDIVYQTITFFFSAGCSAPLFPASGVIDEYTSTEEGSQIQFHCSETNSSVRINASWSPDPQTLVCMQVYSPLNLSGYNIFVE